MKKSKVEVNFNLEKVSSALDDVLINVQAAESQQKDLLIKRSLEDAGYKFSTDEELKEWAKNNGVIEVDPIMKLSTLRVKGKPICSWSESSTSLEGNNVVNTFKAVNHYEK